MLLRSKPTIRAGDFLVVFVDQPLSSQNQGHQIFKVESRNRPNPTGTSKHEPLIPSNTPKLLGNGIEVCFNKRNAKMGKDC
jgi:hypothetical protein